MIIKSLVDNVSNIPDLKSQHGLSLYIKTKGHILLFDMGAGSLFADNARKMRVDLEKVDVAVISHGHYDHGGGLETFLKINKEADIYINRNGFGKYYANGPNNSKTYIGLDSSLLPDERFVFIEGSHRIDDELELFSDVKGKKYNPSGNQDLLKKVNDSFIQDDFIHEQNLIIKEDDKRLLVAGCAHNGIVNILEHYKNINGDWPSHVIGGFHLYSRAGNKIEDIGLIKDIGAFLLETGAFFYTCHCTGLESYMILKSVMGEKIEYLSTGSELVI